MSDTYTVDGEEYDVEGNPSLGTVREVQEMQMGLIKEYIDEDKLMEMDSMGDEEVVQAILDSGGFDAFQEVMWERSLLEPVQTICLACDEVFDSDDFEDAPARDFKDLKEASEESLGGSASDFFKSLGVGMSLDEEKAKEVRAMQNR